MERQTTKQDAAAQGGIGAVEPEWTVGAREAWIAPVRAAADLLGGQVWTRRAGDGHERVGGPIGTAGGLSDRRTRVRRAYVTVPVAFGSRSPPAERASHASATSGTPSSAEPAGQATMWSTLVRHGQASQDETESGTVQGACVSRLWERRERSASGALEPQEGVAVTATTMTTSYASAKRLSRVAAWAVNPEHISAADATCPDVRPAGALDRLSQKWNSEACDASQL